MPSGGELVLGKSGTVYDQARRIGPALAAGAISPMLANLYMNRLLKGWRNTKRGEQFDAHIVNYADDFVILSRGKAAEALNWTGQVVTRMGAT
jgi:reverse transcriptase-like protein